MTKAIDECITHSSGGSYDMVAVYVKGNKPVFGRNVLKKPACNRDSSYPSQMGVHAELSCWFQCQPMRGGTLYVAGRRAANKTIMTTTRPCVYCSALIASTRIRYVVFLQDGVFVKCKPSDLIKDSDV